MSSDGVLVTPVELNRNLLNSFFKFKPQSKLEIFIVKKKNLQKKQRREEKGKTGKGKSPKIGLENVEKTQ